jgi:hypothetical protein
MAVLAEIARRAGQAGRDCPRMRRLRFARNTSWNQIGLRQVLGEIAVENLAIDRRQRREVGDRGTLVDLMHGLPD